MSMAACGTMAMAEGNGKTNGTVENVPEATVILDRVKVAGPDINIRTDCGAEGDGKTNDTEAFRKAAELIKKAGGGRLFIPAGTYIVGRQIHKDGKYPYYQYQQIFAMDRIDGLVIEGESGSVIRMDSNMRFGSFDKDKGTPFDPVAEKVLKNGVFSDSNYQANAGIMFQITNSRNIIIRNLELDGNNGKVTLGGMWGDTGRQCLGHGIGLYGNAYVLIENVNVHHNACDGIIIGYRNLKENDPPAPHVLVNVRSEYNARQGLSWVGGNSLAAVNCLFNHTGKSGFCSKPGAGLDIEAEESICRNGIFRNCEFIDNNGLGVGADSGDGGYTTFENCVIWGTTTYAMWNRKPGMKFNNCKFYGSIIHSYGSAKEPELATQYRNCIFEDKEHPEFGVYRSGSLIKNAGPNVLFDNCDIVANKVTGFYLTNGAIVRNCRITHKNTDGTDGSAQSFFHKSLIENVHFMEKFPDNFSKKYYVGQDRVKVGEGVIVDGPAIKWSNCDGLTGQIPPSVKN